jgi:hypothetical protein
MPAAARPVTRSQRTSVNRKGERISATADVAAIPVSAHRSSQTGSAGPNSRYPETLTERDVTTGPQVPAMITVLGLREGHLGRHGQRIHERKKSLTC